jgi:hypothetical protein
MAGTGWESSDLLARFNRMADRPAPPADAYPDATKYQLLADAQDSVLNKIASVAPRVLYNPPTLMTTSDGGYTFQFGTDGNGYPLFPMGKTRIYQDLDSVPDYPWRPGLDYLDEGTQIRMPNNIQWSGTLYWYGITPPGELSATVAPVLQPPPARILIVIEAVSMFATDFARNGALAQMMEGRWQKEFGPWMTTLRRHFRGGGAMGGLLSSNYPVYGGSWGGAGAAGLGWG